MFRTKFLAATALAGVMATAGFAGVDKISKIDVTVDMAAITNAEAATFWANLEADLENALAARLVDRMLSQEEATTTADGTEDGAVILEGSQILIDVREVELASAFERELNLADSVLVGQVNIKDDTDNTNVDAYELSVTLETAKVVVPEGAVLVLSTDTTGSYQQIVEAFADGVVSRLK